MKNLVKILIVAAGLLASCTGPAPRPGESFNRNADQSPPIGECLSMPPNTSGFADLAFHKSGNTYYAFWTKPAFGKTDAKNLLFVSTTEDLINWNRPKTISEHVPLLALGNGILITDLGENVAGLAVVLVTKEVSGKHAGQAKGFRLFHGDYGKKWREKKLAPDAATLKNMDGLAKYQQATRFSSDQYRVDFDRSMKSYWISEHASQRRWFLGLPQASVKWLLETPDRSPVIVCTQTIVGSPREWSDDLYMLEVSLDRLLEDADQDGLSDVYENFLGTNPADADTDGDRITDDKDFDPMAGNHRPHSFTDSLYQAFVENYFGESLWNPERIVRIRRQDRRRQWFSNHICRIAWAGPEANDVVVLRSAAINQSGVATVNYSVMFGGARFDNLAKLKREGKVWVVTSLTARQRTLAWKGSAFHGS